MPRPATIETGRSLLRDFSLFRFASAEAQRRHVLMRPLGTVERALDPTQAGTFDASVSAMQYWCRLNEKLLLERHYEGARVLVGFERASRVQPVAARYRRLSAKVKELTVFAELDAALPFTARAIDVTGSPLAREWFLAIDAPSYSALLVARDQQGFGPTGPLVGRRFVGLSTHDPELAKAAIDVLTRFAAT